MVQPPAYDASTMCMRCVDTCVHCSGACFACSPPLQWVFDHGACYLAVARSHAEHHICLPVPSWGWHCECAKQQALQSQASVLNALQEGFVVLWMTNREKLWRFVEQQVLPAWDLHVIATWLWLKVTNAGQPISPVVRHPD